MLISPLECSFPVEKINPLALSEGNAKQPIYRMHKWWARRLGRVFRLIVLGVFGVPDAGNGSGSGSFNSPVSHPESEGEALWRAFEGEPDLGGKVVLDPFMGGGTTVVEALRLGCRVIGVDINPVAWFVTKKEVEPANAAGLDAAFERLEASAGERIKPWYRTACPAGHEAEVMYVFWVKRAACAECGAETALFPNYEISRHIDHHVSCCPACLAIVTTPAYDPHTVCGDCGEHYDPRVGTAGRGKFRCGDCGAEGRLLHAVRAKGGPLEQSPHALEGYCLECGRFFKTLDDADHALLKGAEAEFERLRESLLFPRGAIPAEGRSDPRPINHGYTHYHQMFNRRQLLCLSMLLEEILRLPQENERELMLTAFSDCLDANTMFCKYEVAWHKISLFFGLHAYHPIERPTENNVWGTHFGRGTFTRCFEKVRRAKVGGKRPPRRKTGEALPPPLPPCPAPSREGDPVLVEDFAGLLATPRSALLRCQSSERLDFLPDGVVDAVITDPPYFDNVQYSELADFFHVWLHQALKERYPWFRTGTAANGRELVQNEKLGKTADFFNEGLQGVFAECRRVLKDEGLLVFTFHHNRTSAWEGLGDLLLGAGFYVSASPMVRSEGKSGFHSSAGNIKYDAVLVCRKASHGIGGEANSEPWPGARELDQAILAAAIHWARRTLASGMILGEADRFAILMGQALVHGTRALAQARVSGRTAAPLGEVLERVALLTGAVEAATEGSGHPPPDHGRGPYSGPATP